MPVPSRKSPEKAHAPPEPSELPPLVDPDLSEFTQRLASFGLGESPDLLLTKSILPKHRRRRL